MNWLIMSGGGARGSFEAGVLKYLGELAGLARSDDPPAGKVAQKALALSLGLDKGFPGIGATSVGGINGAGLSMYPPEAFAEACLFVVNMWLTQIKGTRSVWRLRCPCGLPALWEPSLGVNTALRRLLTDAVNLEAIKSSGIDLRLPAVDLESGKLRVFTVEDLIEHGIDPILASASFPVAFPPVPLEGQWFTDGGVIDIAPLGTAIDAGADHILCILTRSPEGVPYKSRDQMKNAIAVGLRVIDITTQTVLLGDLAVADLVNALIDADPEHPKAKGKRKVKITTVYPSKPLGDPLDFNADVMRAQIDQGYQDAKDQLNGG